MRRAQAHSFFSLLTWWTATCPKLLLATDTKRVITSSHLHYYSHTSDHLTVSQTFLCQVFNPWNLASTLSSHVNHHEETLSKKKMFCSTVIALQFSPVFRFFEACCDGTRKIGRWHNDAVSCTKRSSRPFLDQNLCEHSGSDILGGLQNKLEPIICDGSKGLLPGWRSFGEVTIATRPFQLLWMSLKVTKDYKTFTFPSDWPNRGDRSMFASFQ